MSRTRSIAGLDESDDGVVEADGLRLSRANTPKQDTKSPGSKPKLFAPELSGLDVHPSVALWDFDESLTAKKWYHMSTLHPHSPVRGVWDLWVLVLLFYCAVAIPFRIAFDLWPMQGTAQEVVEYFIDACFWLDIVLNFRTGLYVEGQLVTSFTAIATDYLRFWFWVDFISVLPFSIIISALMGGQNSSALRLIRLLRVIRVVRVLRMLRLLDRWSKHIYINKVITRSFKFLGCLLFLAHILACLWFWSSHAANGHGEETWVFAYYFEGRDMKSHPMSWDYENNNHEKFVYGWYAVAYYWALMTVTTVGYGDISPFNDLERLMAAFCMLVGGIAYAYVVGTVAVLINEFDPVAQKFDDRIKAVNNYMARRRFPRRLQYLVREHYDHCFRTELLLADGDTIYEDLPEDLQREMLEHLNFSMLSAISVFEDIPRDIVDALPEEVPGFKAVILKSCSAGQVILDEGKESPSLFHVHSGSVAVSLAGQEMSVLQPGRIFGEVALFLEPYTSPARYYAATHCEIYAVPRDVVTYLCSIFPECDAKLRRLADLCAVDLRNEHLASLFEQSNPICQEKSPGSPLTFHAKRGTPAGSRPTSGRGGTPLPESPITLYLDAKKVRSPYSPRSPHSRSPASSRRSPDDISELEERLNSLQEIAERQRGDLEITCSLLHYAVHKSRTSDFRTKHPVPAVHGRTQRCQLGECFHVL